MECLLKIGASGETIKQVEQAVKTLFETAAKTRMDQSTVHAALAFMEKALRVENTHINNCTFTGELAPAPKGRKRK